MKLSRLLSQSTKPLFVVGSEKNAGKTTALNRLRAEAHREGISGFGLCSVGWDGEAFDHFDKRRKPLVKAYLDDVLLTCSSALSSSSARFEILWSGPWLQNIGRMVIVRCLREGNIELIGNATISALGETIERISETGVQRVLVDGAIDRKTPISACPDSEIGFAFVPNLGETPSSFAQRVSNIIDRYRLDLTGWQRPKGLDGSTVAIGYGDIWNLYSSDRIEGLRIDGDNLWAWLGGPLTSDVAQNLQLLGVTGVVVDDPTRLYIPLPNSSGFKKVKLEIRIHKRPEISFIAIRNDAGIKRSLSPIDTLSEFDRMMPGIPCFDPLFDKGSLAS